MIRFMILVATWSLTTVGETLFAQALPNRPIDYSDLKPSIDAVETVRLLSADKASALERDVRRAYAALAPSVVRITQLPEHPTGDGSGVIVDKDGLILTCSHLRLEPKSAVSIEFFDGRRVPGTALGRFRLDARDAQGRLIVCPDIGLVRIAQKGEWPAARIDPRWTPKGGEICLAIGYPGNPVRLSPPLLRLGRLLTPVLKWRRLRSTTSSSPGDSGGPLFDLEGRLLGICSGTGRYEPLAPFHQYRKRLLEGEIVSAPVEDSRARETKAADPGAFAAALDLQDAAQRHVAGVVHVLDGAVEIALGLIVDPDGYVLTKQSLVSMTNRLKCRMRFLNSNTKMVYDARIVASSAKHDLALLKIEAKRLPTIPWNTQADSISLGRIVASLEVEPLTFAVIGANVSADPLTSEVIPQILLKVNAGPHGEAVIGGFPEHRADLDAFRDLVKSGDVLVRLNGLQTPTFEEYGRVSDRLIYASRGANGPIDYNRPADNSFAGDPVILTIRRDGHVLDVHIVKVNPGDRNRLDAYLSPVSLRRHGFPAVFAHDGRLSPSQCGGPVVNLAGEAIGLNIARADNTRTLAIPAGVLKELVDHLLAQAKTGKAN
jgi:serine protease Do